VLFWVIASAAWLAAVALSWALLRPARPTDPPLGTRGVAASWAEIAAAAAPYIGLLLNATDDELIVAAREPWPVGRVVAVAVGGAAAPLLGRELGVDDVAARAALSGRVETRAGAVAAPLRRAGETVGAIALSVRANPGVSVEQTERLLRAAEAINRRLNPVVAALALRA
jgi:hypothetical protein